MDLVYKNSVVGGTFDRLHVGHQKLIDTAFELSDKVTIGLTKSVMYENKSLSDVIEDYDTREKNLKNYLFKKGFIDRAKIVPINDIFGTTLIDEHIEAIFATEENLENLILINKKRQEIGFAPLKTFIVPLVKADDGKNVTSERIRQGEIDKNGFVYKSVFAGKQVLTLPDSFRPVLQKPLGEVVKTTKDLLKMLEKENMVIAVGDIIYEELKKAGIVPAVSIVDLKTRREPFISNLSDFNANEKVINEKGTINNAAVDAIENALDNYMKSNEPQTIVIEGEEDLLALPAILLAPLGSIVLYGQFGMGVVVNKVVEELKDGIKEILGKFE